MKVAIFDTHNFEKNILEEANKNEGNPHELTFFETRLLPETAALGKGYPAICVFVNDKVTSEVIQELSKDGLKVIALRSAGFNNVSLEECEKEGIKVVRVPAYSPNAVAEHAAALLLALNRKIFKSVYRTRDHNFSLDGLLGFDLYGKTVGIIGTGKIGACFARIMNGFGCKILAYDPYPNKELEKNYNLTYCELPQLYKNSDIISLHVPLNKDTKHLLNEKAFSLMKEGVYLINTSRGGLIDTRALIQALKERKLGGAALDVYEEEEGIFFFDLSDKVLMDDVLARLITFNNVIITSHQAFLTKEALDEIARTTVRNLMAFERGEPLENEVKS